MIDASLDQLVQAVLTSPKYKTICRDVIRHIGQQELAERRSLKEAVKATKNKLHQVGGAYLPGKINYAAWLKELKAASPAKWDNFVEVCARIMNQHASTRERLPILSQFYTTLLADLPPLHTVVDIACGLNPLALPWMPVAVDVTYYAYDIYQDMVDFLNAFMALAGVKGQAEARDVINDCPTPKVDLAFILKAIPCLEQIDKSAGPRLLDMINADHLLISFPVHSLGGREKGMSVNYETRFWELVANKDWAIKRFEFANELVFLVTKSGTGEQ
jgi:16S rRNA (guanine(1405)-N(7))-methyltransferase